MQGRFPWTTKRIAKHDLPKWRGPWEVVLDPSQDFLGSRFNWFDIYWGATFRSWPDGITFRHITKGTTVQYVNGELVEISGDNDPLWPFVAAAI